MNNGLKRLWKYLDKNRGSAPMHESLLEALVSEQDIEVTTDLLGDISRLYGSRFSASYLSSPDVAAFIAEIAATRAPSSVLDPTCGSGLLLKMVTDGVNASTIHGVEINESIAQVAERLLGKGASVFVGDVLRAGIPLNESYDLIVSEPPFGMRMGHPLELDGADSPLKGDFSDVLAAWTCTKLSEKGMAILILPPSFLWSKRSEQAKKTLSTLGCAVTGCIQLPSGSLQGTGIEAYIVVIERGEQADLFVGQYTTDSAHQRVLAENFASRKEGHRPAQGRLCSWGDFRGYSSIEATERIKRLVVRLGFDPIPMSKLVVKAIRTNKRDFKRLKDLPNSVYLPLTGRGRATTNQESLSDRLKDYIQLQLDPQLADARFVASLFNQEVGQAILDTMRTGTTIKRVHPSDLIATTFYLPSLKTQARLLASLDQIASIRGEIDELEAVLWSDTRNIDQLARQVETVNHEDRFEDWIDTLPFPLATILWRYRAEGASLLEKSESLLHFFEALAEFMATVHLSAFSSDPEIWSAQGRKLFKALDKKNHSLERGTFGSWRSITGYLGARCRELAHKTPDVCFSLYRTRNLETLRMLGSSTLSTVLQRANGMRNDLSHGGAVGEQQAKSIHAELLSLVQQYRGVVGRHWLDYELLQPGEARFRDGISHYKARRLMGARTPCPVVDRESIDQMDDRMLYLFDPSSNRGLQMLPFVRMLPSPPNEPNACYFFNRVQAGQCRYVSYYFDKDPDRVDAFSDTLEAIRQLQVAAPFSGSSEEGG